MVSTRIRWRSRMAGAIGLGFFLGCVCAFLFPKGFSYSRHSTPNLQISGSSIKLDSTSCALIDRAIMLKSDYRKMSTFQQITGGLINQVAELKEKLRLATQEKGNLDVSDIRANPVLVRILQSIAIRKEVIVTFLNSDANDLLEIWHNNIRKVAITNYFLVAIDNETEKLLNTERAEIYRIHSGYRTGNLIGKAESNQVLKYRLLIEILHLGYSVLLSDIDIVYLQNPFDYLYRDSDVELMSNGHDNITAYGYYDDHKMSIPEHSSAFFYIRPTINSIKLLDRIVKRLSRSNLSDQTVLNQELFFPSRPGYTRLHCSKRTMEFYLFTNSKVLFQNARNNAFLDKHKPAIVHISDHQDKLLKMKAVVEFYVHGNNAALDPFTFDPHQRGY